MKAPLAAGGPTGVSASSSPRRWPSLLVLSIMLLAGCSSRAKPLVAIEESRYAPEILEVEVGASVQWFNRDPVVHTVTPKDASSWGTGGSPALSRGQTWTFAFDQAGRYEYYCQPHPFMSGVVLVGAAVRSPTAMGTNDTVPSPVA